MTGEAPERLHLAHQMQRTWLAFARHGDPATDGLPRWPRYDLEHRATLLFDRESTIHHDPQAEARRVWASVAPPV
jgi:para-nitrobenzyl esterase